MATSAYLFPGQGAQYVGMGQSLYDAYDEAAARIDAANDVLGFDLRALMFGTADVEDAKAALTATEVTQPALYTHSLAAMAVLDAHGAGPAMVAGHSLGEYSALAAAGALSFEDGLRLVRRRGELMAEAGKRRPGTMAAVLGADDDAVETACTAATEAGDGVVQPANFNAPGQIVISGDVEAVERATERLDARTIPLSVSGAFHSPLMDYAREGLASALEAVAIQKPRCPVYLNVTAQPTADPDEIRQRLLDQLQSPVRWAQLLRAMDADGATRFVEVGAGSVLQGLVKRTLGRDATRQGVDTADDCAAFLENPAASR